MDRRKIVIGCVMVAAIGISVLATSRDWVTPSRSSRIVALHAGAEATAAKDAVLENPSPSSPVASLKFIPSAPTRPYDHVREAIAHLGTVEPEQRVYTRYLSFYDTPSASLLEEVKLCFWWIHQMSFEPAVTLPKEVPGTGMRLFSINLVDYRWNPEAWEAVARRDPRFREPWIPWAEAVHIRRLIESGHVNQEGTETRPLIAIVSARSFLRDTLETRRASSYYDLLFAERRHLKGGKREIEFEEVEKYQDKIRVYHTGGPFKDEVAGLSWSNVAPGYYWKTVEKQQITKKKKQIEGAKFVNFPKDEEEWEQAFGVDKLKQVAAATKVDFDFGSVVAGGGDHPKDGSIVSLNNRLIVTLSSPFGSYMETYDVNETTGKRDFLEQLMFGGKKYKRGDLAQAFRDAGELLASLPNGGQAALLINGKGERVEVAGGDIAADTADPNRRNPGVRTPGSCVTCHAGSGGFIPPRDLVSMLKAKGIEPKTDQWNKGLSYEEKQQLSNRIKSFFGDWQERIDGWTTPYKSLLRKTTAVGDDTPLTGAAVGDLVATFRADYDSPVDAATAARELGIDQVHIERLLLQSPRGRAWQMLKGEAIPRRTWDVDLMPETGKLLDANRPDRKFDRLGIETEKKK